MPGRMPPTSQLDWLISTTAMIVLFWSRATRDLLKSFGWGIATLHRLIQRRSCHPCRPPHSISPLEGTGFEPSVPREAAGTFYPSIRARPVAPCSLTVWRRVSHRALRCGPPACGGKGRRDMVGASALACSSDLLLRLAGCQSQDLVAEVRRTALAASDFCSCRGRAPAPW